MNGRRLADGLLFPVLHAVTTDDVLQNPAWLGVAREVMRTGGPRVAIHLRASRLEARTLFRIAAALAPDEDRTGAWIVVNDRVDIALAAGVRGVQLTSRSLDVPDARRAAPSILLGASIHSDVEGETAESAGADWAVAGNVFRTATHPDRDEKGLDFVRRVATRLRIPVVAIGGITPEHVPVLVDAGLAGIAAIRGIWAADDAPAAARDYLSRYDAAVVDGGGADAHRQR